MARDLIKELREIAATPPGKQSLWDCTIAAWAADEIERLRLIIEAARDDLTDAYLAGSYDVSKEPDDA